MDSINVEQLHQKYYDHTGKKILPNKSLNGSKLANATVFDYVLGIRNSNKLSDYDLDKLIDIITENKIIESKTEFRRLLEAGAVSDYPDKKLNDPNEIVGEVERKIKIGKKTFIVLKP